MHPPRLNEGGDLSHDGVARGADAESPVELTGRAWIEILWRVWTKSGKHNIGFLAAGVAFYGFLSLVPALGLVVMLYGIFSDPQSIFERMVEIIRLVPAEAAMLINDQLSNLISTAAATHGFAAIPAVVIYNHLARVISGYKTLLTDASAQLLLMISRGYRAPAATLPRAAE